MVIKTERMQLYVDGHCVGECRLHGLVEEAVQVAGVTSGHAGSPDGVLKDQIPANQESDTFTCSKYKISFYLLFNFFRISFLLFK